MIIQEEREDFVYWSDTSQAKFNNKVTYLGLRTRIFAWRQGDSKYDPLM